VGERVALRAAEVLQLGGVEARPGRRRRPAPVSAAVARRRRRRQLGGWRWYTVQLYCYSARRLGGILETLHFSLHFSPALLQVRERFLSPPERFDVVVLNAGQQLAVAGYTPAAQRAIVAAELGAWQRAANLVVWATSGFPMEWRMPRENWLPRFCYLQAALLHNYVLNEADVVRSYHRSVVLFDTHSIGAARDDWHNVGDAVHCTVSGYTMLALQFLQQLLETGRVRAMKHRGSVGIRAQVAAPSTREKDVGMVGVLLRL